MDECFKIHKRINSIWEEEGVRWSESEGTEVESIHGSSGSAFLSILLFLMYAGRKSVINL